MYTSNTYHLHARLRSFTKAHIYMRFHAMYHMNVKPTCMHTYIHTYENIKEGVNPCSGRSSELVHVHMCIHSPITIGSKPALALCGTRLFV